ncbi:MAG: glycosyltransferase family 4 protein, partial [Candidatus Bathyarchaeota archaeon]|nr:glycosyltransferase family 4 protein [Candidatus Bathyarchaeota archaeon]
MQSTKHRVLASARKAKTRQSPRILFLEPQPCIRALKYARGLKWAFHGGIEIIFGHLYHTLNELYGHGDEVFDKLVRLHPANLKRDIKRLVKKSRPLFIHSHNAPDVLTISAIEALEGEVPVIHDCHEALSLRETGYYASDDQETIRSKYPRQEKMANEQSDGRIYVTEGVRDYIQERYDVDQSRDMVFYSFVSKSTV